MQRFRDYTVYVYMLRCADDSYYVGSTRKTLDERIGEHNSGVYAGYTFTRRPVELVWSQDFPNAVDAIACGDWKLVSALAKRRGGKPKR